MAKQKKVSKESDASAERSALSASVSAKNDLSYYYAWKSGAHLPDAQRVPAVGSKEFLHQPVRRTQLDEHGNVIASTELGSSTPAPATSASSSSSRGTVRASDAPAAARLRSRITTFQWLDDGKWVKVYISLASLSPSLDDDAVLAEGGLVFTPSARSFLLVLGETQELQVNLWSTVDVARCKASVAKKGGKVIVKLAKEDSDRSWSQLASGAPPTVASDDESDASSSADDDLDDMPDLVNAD